ncbi:MAG TPA: hypothetical protein VGC13_08585 [Longimicrobium sp.]|jgi:hypothetical protein|uniref:hypothetical protein n=1 Tax=Longimicrobium sp. TaxID=2029185 RepID=UPI002ED9FCDB
MDALRRLLLRHREPLRRACGGCAVAVPLGFAAGALVVDGWAARRFLLLYVAPFFVALFVWARIRLGRMREDRTAALLVDAAAVALGAVRFAGPFVPFSGHMLFFAYSALTTRSAPYLLLALVLAAETTWFKLVLWRDPYSWGLGIVVGVALAAARILIHRTALTTVR